MWRRATILLIFTISVNRIAAKFFSEAGGYRIPDDNQPPPVVPDAAQYYDFDLGRDNLSPYQQQQPSYNDNEKLAGIVDELQKMQNVDGQNFGDFQEAYQENPFDVNDPNNNFDFEALEKLKNQVQPAEKPVESEKERPEQVSESNKQPLSAEKKGQAEFIGFVEPVVAKQLKNVEMIDKRVPVQTHSGNVQGVRMVQSSGNIVFIALITMCCVVAVVGVVGGAYYYKEVRKNNDNTFDDFTRYSPAGPGRDKTKKKGSRGSGGNITENGDESLAYKAQLHHYQQTKQKIIGAEEGMAGIPGVDDEDKSDDELEEHNFSVYECPGLAPTGDIEVQNPNFDINRTVSP